MIVLSALIAHTAWHWMADRFADLRKFPLPALDAAAAASLMRWAMAAIVVAVLIWLADGINVESIVFALHVSQNSIMLAIKCCLNW